VHSLSAFCACVPPHNLLPPPKALERVELRHNELGADGAMHIASAIKVRVCVFVRVVYTVRCTRCAVRIGVARAQLAWTAGDSTRVRAVVCMRVVITPHSLHAQSERC
jgi:hypothetical protein